MTITIRAAVRRTAPGQWSCTVYRHCSESWPIVTRSSHPTHAAAITTAHELLRLLDAQLMDEVHASRVSRRDAAARREAMHRHPAGTQPAPRSARSHIALTTPPTHLTLLEATA